jgi:spermidine/putrescine transport system ATP-binding protein
VTTSGPASGPARAVVEVAGHRISGRPAGPLAPGEPAVASLRPEQIALRRSGDGLPVRVVNRIFLGEHTEYLLRHDGLGDILALVPRQAESVEAGFEPGEAAVATWPDGAALILKDD